MIKKNVTCVGIEVRHSRDPQTKVVSDKYYFHGTCNTGSEMVAGDTTVFSAKLPDSVVPSCYVGSTYDVIYRNYQGWLTVEEVYCV